MTVNRTALHVLCLSPLLKRLMLYSGQNMNSFLVSKTILSCAVIQRNTVLLLLFFLFVLFLLLLLLCCSSLALFLGFHCHHQATGFASLSLLSIRLLLLSLSPSSSTSLNCLMAVCRLRVAFYRLSSGSNFWIALMKYLACRDLPSTVFLLKEFERLTVLMSTVPLPHNAFSLRIQWNLYVNLYKGSKQIRK